MNLPVLRSRAEVGTRGWDPLRYLDPFDDLYSLLGGRHGQHGGNAWVPVAGIAESDDAYLVEVELPGIKREDVTVELIGATIVVRGSSADESANDGRRARRSGRFACQIALPAEVRDDQITADLADGLLTVRVPKSERAQPRRIEVR